MDKQHLDIINLQIEILIERAYRRGFSHGHEVGKSNPQEDYTIHKWRNFWPGFEKKGAPGTFLEDKDINSKVLEHYAQFLENERLECEKLEKTMKERFPQQI